MIYLKNDIILLFYTLSDNKVIKNINMYHDIL